MTIWDKSNEQKTAPKSRSCMFASKRKQQQQREGKGNKKGHCRDPGFFRARASSPDLNQGPSDLQSDALPTELSRQLTSKSRNKLTTTKIAHFLQELLMFNTMISCRQCV